MWLLYGDEEYKSDIIQLFIILNQFMNTITYESKKY